MFHILSPNPEAYRDWQYNEYQCCIGDDQDEEPVRCEVCGNDVHDKYTSVGGGCYVCEECIEYEMSENDYSRDEAIKSLTQINKPL